MPLDPTEVIVGSGPKNTNGVRNEFIDVWVEMLRDANIPARIATLSEVGPEHTPLGWAQERGDREPLFVVVPKDYRSQALQINTLDVRYACNVKPTLSRERRNVRDAVYPMSAIPRSCERSTKLRYRGTLQANSSPLYRLAWWARHRWRNIPIALKIPLKRVDSQSSALVTSRFG